MAELTMTLLLAALGVAAGAVVGGIAGRAARARRAADETTELAAARLREEAAAERRRVLQEAELAAREEALSSRTRSEAELRVRTEGLGAENVRHAARAVALDEQERAVADVRQRLHERAAPIVMVEKQSRADRKEARAVHESAREALEQAAGEPAERVRAALIESETDEARAAAVLLLRQVNEGAASPEHVRRAKRLMGIAVGRFAGHYLTERHLSMVPLVDVRNVRVEVGEPHLRIIEAAAGVRLSLTDTGDAVRLEGLDGVGRELARRCLATLLKRPSLGEEVLTRVSKDLSVELEREILELGRRAFSVLEIPRSHPEIVKLVGRLNWRTSYTQNQWKHAIESAFLCGMIADELGLDRKIARRAALIHDIGKALTHELDGSHAVIGADYARRLGETEIVANAIGAHHTDEPFNSPYAYLVAAGDAMSGARPGARRQSEDNHVAKIAELERLSRGFAGVEEAFAVQGGREVRVYVREDRVDDLGAVKLSSEIAEIISKEMTFPGQIRVTVIREFRAVETAS